MQRQARTSASLVAVVLLVGACSERADRNPNALGSPGTGNATEVVRPAADSGNGGPSGIAGSAPQTGASGVDVAQGLTGSGGTAGTDIGGRGQTAQTGTGLNGGLGAQSASTVLGGSPGGLGLNSKSTSGSAVGQR